MTFQLADIVHCVARAPALQKKWVGLGWLASINLISLYSGILVYTDGGLGASETCVAMTLNSLRRAVSLLSGAAAVNPRAYEYAVETTDSEEIVQGGWKDSCRLLVMPGGRDSPYVDRLQGVGNRAIRNFVRNGGSYLGICAGGYYGTSFVEFAKGDPLLEVIGSRELAFFPGMAQGPSFPGFHYQTNAGARGANIKLTGAGVELLQKHSSEGFEHLDVHFNGGCHFIPPSGENLAAAVNSDEASTRVTPSESDFQPLATYTELPREINNSCSDGASAADDPLAIVACSLGRGKVILSGVHFEASADLLAACHNGDTYIASLLPLIRASDARREVLFNCVLKYLLN